MSTGRLMRLGLTHRWMEKDAEFFSLIDSTGGWPVGYEHVGFEHTDTRNAGFTNSPHNDGWWTIVASADDYYLWKLSPQALQRIVDATVSAIRLPGVSAQKLYIRNSSGYEAAKAAMAKEPQS